ncbi:MULTISPECIES: RNB domain-containing ribonuclease [unclassified Rhodococcus (in: high G+C Gram-positive bacteria)]|uniref:RNB domain-containing ribonuclease n=1 Tax=unclassified Rhodococcus (in: high G+C Gram-positive bacteria) TaxID=192944 RepID=UPI001639BD9C|nr:MULTISPECIES: RNB domain-containing ribonuclease [unclassified Rhodococcus (in: high G+C Gram-positive bacteria)]MBC2637840.1 RNB domain-containing ribonuclease [Rhodococcus sp. 3A]MBC2897413.1 RNB domain-containing ribonuclease [Rhodococcus sp. 4CII]
MTSSTATDMSTLLMIDSQYARDRDDAFSVVPRADGRGWTVEVHIAGVADVVELGSVADEQAFLRAETRYLPGRTIAMLGDTAEQAATLTADARRTSLRVTGTLTTGGQLVDVTVRRGDIASGRCVAVDHAEASAILTDPQHPLHPPLAAADAAAQVLLTARRDGGALAFYDLTRGWAASEDGAIVAIPDALRTVAYVIVQELMIATNEAVALWCVERGLPILFRNHRANPVAGSTDELMTEIAAAAGDPDLFAKLRGRLLSTLRAATYDPTVHGHYGLRLSAYTHVTSPLRRVADLINQRIIFADLDSSPGPYTGEQLAALGADLNRRTRAAREAKKNRFKHADQRLVAQEAARDLTALDSRTFHKVLKCAAARPLRTELASELARRVDADLLTAPDVAVLIDAADPTWLPMQLRVLDTLAATHPEMGPSVVSVWRQTHPDHPPTDLEVRRSGVDHHPLFAARATHLGIRGPWTIGSAKKPTEQAALWAAVRAQLIGTEPADAEPDWHTTAPTPRPATPPPAPNDVGSPVSPEPHRKSAPAALNLEGAKKSKALSNPTAWLMSLAQNNNQPPPEWEFHIDGPAHAPRFTATVHLAGHRATADATTKTSAKTASAAALVEALFEIRPLRGTA